MYRIGILDNTIHHVLKSFEALRRDYAGTELFSHESELYEYLEKHSLDALLLNLDLTPNDACHLVRELRAMMLLPQPLLVVYSLKTDDFVQEVVLENGADAFINFHRKPSVLRPFMKNLLARRESVAKKNPASLVLDAERHLIFQHGMPVELPRKEFRLMQLLFSNRHRFLSKNEIAITIWNDEKVAEKRVIDVHIYNLRKMLGPDIIQSKKKQGYRLNGNHLT